MTRWSLLLQTPSSSYTTSWDSTQPTTTADSVSIDSINVNPGQEFLLPVRVNNVSSDPGLRTFTFQVQYDPNVIVFDAAGSIEVTPFDIGIFFNDDPQGLGTPTAGATGWFRFNGGKIGSNVSGDVLLAQLHGTVVGAPGATTTVTFNSTGAGDGGIEVLGDGTAELTVTSVVDGMVTINTPPTFSFSTPTVSVAEDVGTLSLTVNLSPTTSPPVSLSYSTSDIGGTATSGDDFGATSRRSELWSQRDNHFDIRPYSHHK